MAREPGNTNQLAKVAICVGKDCSKRAECMQLQSALQAACDVRLVSCLGVCKGPVAVVQTGSQKPVVLRKLRKPKTLRDLLKMLLCGEPLSKRLKALRVEGNKRRKAVAKAQRALCE